ncbi:MAG: sulfurtransferase TusA family protein [Humibacillus sp.]
MSPHLIDGGDRACGELLIVLAARARQLSPGSLIRLLASDPAAPLDVPAWCHLTGHSYLGRGTDGTARPYYDIQTAVDPARTDPNHAWRLEPEASTPQHL